MLLDKVKARIRVRTPWEAADLGTVLIGAFWKPIYLATFGVMLPFVVTALLLFDDWFYALLFIWFFKPLYDRIPLYVLSHALIGDTPTVRESLRFRNIFDSTLISSLLHYRLNPLLFYKRSFTLPVFILEGLKAYPRSARIKILSRFGTNGLTLCTLYLNIESVLYTSVILLIFVLLNPYTPHLSSEKDLVNLVSSLEQFFQHDLIVTVGLYAFAVLIVEPLYVAAGFTQYLNRRTQMEGWDIELGFRLLAQTHGLASNTSTALTDNTKRPVASRATGAAILLAFTMLVIPPPVEANPAYTDPSRSREMINEVATDERLRTGSRVTTWKKRDAQSARSWNSTWERKTSEPLAFGLKMVLIAVLLGVLTFFIYYSIRHWRPAVRRNSAKNVPPLTLFGLEVDPESLPQNVISEVKRLWSAQQFRDSLSLLYRATLSRVVNQEGIQLKHSDTEGDCVQRVKQHSAPPKAAYFEVLVSSWQALAYARRPPSAPQFDYLCQHWAALFDVPIRQEPVRG